MLVLSVQAANTGLLTVAWDPKGTSQNCSNCGQKVPKKLSQRWYSCDQCGYEVDRD